MKACPWRIKWFLWLMLIRPISDMFWYVKDSGFLSPAQILGFLTFVLASYYWLRSPNASTRVISALSFGFFSILLFLNSLVLNLGIFNLNSMGEFIRVISPVVIFLYLRSQLTGVQTINGIFTTFVFSSIIPVSMMMYEGIFQPIRIVELSESRGGGVRLTGLYADLFNYMSYIIGNYFIFSVFFISRSFHGLPNSLFRYSVIVGISIFGLIGLKHQASWGVFSALFLIFLFFQLASKKGKMIFFTSVLSLALASGVLWESVISPLFAKEINAYNGDADQDRALNGRIIRWQEYFDEWNLMGSFNHFFGVGFTQKDSAAIMMSGGMHSDYIRLLFSTGIFGLVSFVLFYISVLYRSFQLRGPTRFYIMGSVFIMMLYGISSNPFGSSGALMYLTLMGLALGTIEFNRSNVKAKR